MENLRKQWNDACLSAGINSISPQKSAKIMAVLMHLGNNEAMVMNQHFIADVYYIQQRYKLQGGEVPDAEFVEYFKESEQELKKSLDNNIIPQWAEKLFKEDYDIKLWY
jgi:stalled ribosome rescue protein Dom34